MMKILGIAGKKSAGKNTMANIVHGIVLKENKMIKDYNIDEGGKLFVLTSNSDGEEGWGEFDITRKDTDFASWAEWNMWPEVKIYSFADSLKSICIRLFNIPPECVYGTDEQKNQIVPHLRWENMPGVITDKKFFYFLTEQHKISLESKGLIYHEPGPMTAREFMQFFGTEIMRKMYSNIWINDTINRIKSESSKLAIIADVRFPNEIDAILNNGGKVVKLNRSIHKDGHSSEISLDNLDNSKFYKIIDNGKEGYTIEDLMLDTKKLYNNL